MRFLPWCLVLGCTLTASAQQPPVVEHGTYAIHLLLHVIGTEEYNVTDTGAGALTLKTTTATSDRGMKRTASSTLTMAPGYIPTGFHQTSSAGGTDTISDTALTGNQVTIAEPAGTRTIPRPATAFPGAGGMPAAAEMMMMRYWLAHGRPARLNLLRGSAEAQPVEIRMVGHEAFTTHGHLVRLTRYTVANLVYGREILWMNDAGRLVAVMTFAGGLPQEIVLEEYEETMGELFHSGVIQEMLDLAQLTREVKPQAQGTYAIVGARLIDGRGGAPLENATVLVRDGRIAAAGAGITVPHGMRVVHAEGQSLLPGLWEMHSHFSGVEFGPALLAAGITTARDCGGEREFLLSVRRAMDHGALGPRLLLAGLIDSAGPLAFGSVIVDTPEQGVAAVDSYADAGFEQIKVYTQIQPEVLKAIAAEAHRRGMTVTGHVPAAVDTFEGIADGMDMINHLQYVTREATDNGKSPLNLQSTRFQQLLTMLKEKQIVVDPTVGWGEMASHPKTTDAATFEPGVRQAPWTLESRFETMGSAGPAAAHFDEREKANLAVVGALYKAGVPIVAGSDTGLIGYGIDRELELYVEAGMTPLEAIATATSIPARVMKRAADLGTIEAGKRADLVLVQGDPSTQISDLRHVVSVVKDGRMYRSAEVAATVGFKR